MQPGLRLKPVSAVDPAGALSKLGTRLQPGLAPSPIMGQDEHHGPGPETAGPARILLVEDDFLIAMQIEAALSDAGYRVVGVAASAEEAVQLAALHRPELAIMDIRLAGARDGVDAALELYRDHGLRCIFASAHADKQVTDRARPAHPLSWLRKPYSTASLIDATRQALEELKHPRN